ncbi:MAG: hypothetical protein BroJett040_20710 [Oligoflexia bacterium]|nr:MAG: hypothetical protein BroJett040_20710 [Oligoflexia bacterium]
MTKCPVSIKYQHVEQIESYYDQLSQHLFSQLQAQEEASLYLQTEDQSYLRLNNSQVRQSTYVNQKEIELVLQKNHRKISIGSNLTGHFQNDKDKLSHILNHARSECESLPPDPYLSPLQLHESTDQKFSGQLPPLEEFINDLCQHTQGSDFTGLAATGPMIRASANSLGQRHWFSTESFFVDYSLFTKNVSGENKAVKGCYANRDFSTKEFLSQLETSKLMLETMKLPTIEVPKGSHRCFLAPAAVAEIMGMFSWGAVSFDSYKKGTSAFQKIANNEVQLSPLFTLKENFQLGLCPRFNSSGEIAPSELTIIENGRMKNFLISARSAKEYSVTSNGADYNMWGGEYLRSPEILGGNLPESEALRALDTGLYISNLHYLNWSDFQNARLTGMTRYACVWVEKGQIKGPIRDLRFDESLFRAFGSELEALTLETKIDPAIDTYHRRALGGKKCPGMLIKDFRFTL